MSNEKLIDIICEDITELYERLKKLNENKILDKSLNGTTTNEIEV